MACCSCNLQSTSSNNQEVAKDAAETAINADAASQLIQRELLSIPPDVGPDDKNWSSPRIKGKKGENVFFFSYFSRQLHEKEVGRGRNVLSAEVFTAPTSKDERATRLPVDEEFTEDAQSPSLRRKRDLCIPVDCWGREMINGTIAGSIRRTHIYGDVLYNCGARSYCRSGRESIPSKMVRCERKEMEKSTTLDKNTMTSFYWCSFFRFVYI